MAKKNAEACAEALMPARRKGSPSRRHCRPGMHALSPASEEKSPERQCLNCDETQSGIPCTPLFPEQRAASAAGKNFSRILAATAFSLAYGRAGACASLPSADNRHSPPKGKAPETIHARQNVGRENAHGKENASPGHARKSFPRHLSKKNGRKFLRRTHLSMRQRHTPHRGNTHEKRRKERGRNPSVRWHLPRKKRWGEE